MGRRVKAPREGALRGMGACKKGKPAPHSQVGHPLGADQLSRGRKD